MKLFNPLTYLHRNPCTLPYHEHLRTNALLPTGLAFKTVYPAPLNFYN